MLWVQCQSEQCAYFSPRLNRMGLHLFCSPFPCTLQTLPEVLRRISHHPQLFSCIVVPKQATLPHFPGCRIYFMGARQAGRHHGCQMAVASFIDRTCLALQASGLWLRYATLQNLIPSFPWIAPPRPPPWRNPRKGSNQILPSGNLGRHAARTCCPPAMEKNAPLSPAS